MSGSSKSSSSNCSPCSNAAPLDLSGPPGWSGYVKGLLGGNTYYRTISYHGCDPYGSSDVSWTFDPATCRWVETTGNRVPDFIHNYPCTVNSDTEMQCTGSQSPPCDGDPGDKYTLSNPVTCGAAAARFAPQVMAAKTTAKKGCGCGRAKRGDGKK